MVDPHGCESGPDVPARKLPHDLSLPLRGTCPTRVTRVSKPRSSRKARPRSILSSSSHGIMTVFGRRIYASVLLPRQSPHPLGDRETMAFLSRSCVDAASLRISVNAFTCDENVVSFTEMLGSRFLVSTNEICTLFRSALAFGRLEKTQSNIPRKGGAAAWTTKFTFTPYLAAFIFSRHEPIPFLLSGRSA